MKTKKISEFATLQSGLVLNRREARFEEETEVIYNRLNLRSLNEYGEIKSENLDFFPSKSLLDDPFLTQKGDVVVKLSAPLFPTVIEESNINLVIPSQLAVIRIFDQKVIPEYVRYYLSTDGVSKYITSVEGGTVLHSIKINTLADLKIPIPTVEKQRLIVNIAQTNSKIEKLYKELVKQESKLATAKIQKFLGGKLQ
ncbi:MAG TPA: hypothetical protein DD413_03925 [Ruminococcus sp.]|nr:hypothetical protein [Ruminococcus sp.]